MSLTVVSNSFVEEIDILIWVDSIKEVRMSRVSSIKKAYIVLPIVVLISLIASVLVLLSPDQEETVSEVKGSSEETVTPAEEPDPEITVGEMHKYPQNLTIEPMINQGLVTTTGTEARWAYLPGDEPFNDVISEYILEELRDQAEKNGVKYTPEAHIDIEKGCISGDPADSAESLLNEVSTTAKEEKKEYKTIQCYDILASGSKYGQMIRTVVGSEDEEVQDYAETFYTDIETGDVAKGSELLSDEGVLELHNTLYEMKGVDIPMSGEETITPTQDSLNTLRESLYNAGFSEKGDFHITVSEEYIKLMTSLDEDPDPTEITFVIPAALTHRTLTELGEKISRSIASEESWRGEELLPSEEIYVDCEMMPCVAVTYDDGPSIYTSEVLNAYADLPAVATFFILGENIYGNEDLIRRADQEGNEIANHSWSHPPFTTLSDEEIREEVTKTNQALKEITGKTPVLHRPPYGDFNERTLKATEMPAIMWSIDTLDWQHPGKDLLIEETVAKAESGDVILMHDIHEDTTVVAKEIAEGLLDRGFSLVTVSQLLGDGLSAQPYYSK